MVKFSVFADEISSDFAEQIDVMGECGIQYMDLRTLWGKSVTDLTDSEINELKKILDGQNIKIAALGSSIGKSSIDKPKSYELDRLKRTTDIAEVLDVKYLRAFSFYAPDGGNIANYKDVVFERIQGWIQWIKDERRSVVLAHENDADIYGATPSRCLELMQEFHSAYFSMCFDIANWNYVGEKDVFERCWMPLKKYVSTVHLKDFKIGNHMVPCGFGDSPVEKVVVDAYSDGFNGFMTIEPHLQKNYLGFTGQELFKKALSSVKNIFERNNIEFC